MRLKPYHLLLGSLTFVCGIATFQGVQLAEVLIDNYFFYRINSAVPTQSLVDEPAEERAVYRTVIEELYVDQTTKMVTIGALTTRCSLFEDGIADIRPKLEDPFVDLREIMLIGKDTTADYVAKNNTSSKLELGNLKVPHQLVSEDFFGEGKSGWEGFYKRYPDSSGLIFLSRVGFNNNHNQAFIYVGKSCGGLCGGGGYVSLKKVRERWIITNHEGIWVS